MGRLRLFAGVFTLAACGQLVCAQGGPPVTENATEAAKAAAELLNKIDLLVEHNRQLETQNQDLLEEINSLRQFLAKQSQPDRQAGKLETEASAHPGTPTEAAGGSEPAVAPTSSSSSSEVTNVAVRGSMAQEQPAKWGKYTPNFGYKVADTDFGDLSVSIYSYGRYLNQLGLDASYTDAFGNLKNVQQRQDFQLNKVQVKFLGWIMNEKFRYFLYAWTSNASQGQGAQVVLAGNLNYSFTNWFNVGVGIRSLPGTRSVEGNFPFWLGVDTRLIADEFFRPSYSSGVWASGKIGSNLNYTAMIANNLSTLGVSAAQLNNGFNTFSGSLVWMPTTGEFGAGFGDFEQHDSLAPRFGLHFSRSDEDTQEQPNSDQFENTQIRLEDGTVIFTPNIFGQGVVVTDVRYRMSSFDAGLKYHGYSLEGEYFLRWLDNFKGPGTGGLPTIFSHGFQLQASAMVVPKSLQVYLGGSTPFHSLSEETGQQYSTPRSNSRFEPLRREG
jgi:hypothetical protein